MATDLRAGLRQSLKTSLKTGLVSATGGGFDADATAYIAAVEAADGAALEAGVKTAINDFVVGCKADGIWTALKASCILSGARTLSGALVPLSGTAPTNFNFVSGDYDRKTGLKGNGSTKYLNSNRAENADPQNSVHTVAYVTGAFSAVEFILFGGSGGASFTGLLSDGSSLPTAYSRNLVFGTGTGTLGFMGGNRSGATNFNFRLFGTTGSNTGLSVAPGTGNYEVFRSPTWPTNYLGTGRLAFYSIGESLDLALLDARVTTLIAAYDAAILDAYYANVSLLLHGNGTNGSTTITDNSPSPKTVTAVGDAQISTAQSKFGGASIAFDGTGDSLTTPNNSAYQFGTSDFTVECWINTTDVTFNLISLLNNAAGNWAIVIFNSDFYWQTAYGITNLISALPCSSILNGAWNHIAITRSGSSLRLFFNGVLQGASPYTDNTNYNGTGSLAVGSGVNGDLNGYIDDFRITKGVARYTANFTPPAAQFPDS